MHTDSMRTRLELLLLTALGPGPRPAHRLAGEVRRRGAEASTGAVFDALHRLEGDRLVARRRPVYELTRRGRARLERERSAWVALARTVAAAYERAP
jgi:DNA-binding PadR family transcriptional regulator